MTVTIHVKNEILSKFCSKYSKVYDYVIFMGDFSVLMCDKATKVFVL